MSDFIIHAVTDAEAVELVDALHGNTRVQRAGFGVSVGRRTAGLGNSGGLRGRSRSPPKAASASAQLVKPSELVEDILHSGALSAAASAGDVVQLSDVVYSEAYDYAYGANIRAAMEAGKLHQALHDEVRKDAHLYALAAVTSASSLLPEAMLSASGSQASSLVVQGHLYKSKEAPIGLAVLVRPDQRRRSDVNVQSDDQVGAVLVPTEESRLQSSTLVDGGMFQIDSNIGKYDLHMP